MMLGATTLSGLISSEHLAPICTWGGLRAGYQSGLKALGIIVTDDWCRPCRVKVLQRLREH
eukprot:11252393-Alexandrium_andersonii.AAC.1